MVTIEQIRAARGLLNWTQDDLANAAFLSKPSINNIERKLSKPRNETILAIQSAFEKAGVEFIEGGARFKAECLNVKIMEGSECVTRLLWDVLGTLDIYKGKKELLVSGIQEQRFVQVCGENFQKYLKKVEKMGIEERLLALEEDDFFVTHLECYRWVPANVFAQVPYFIYGNKYAIILWGPPQKVILIENDMIADSYRRQFYGHWQEGKIPKIKTTSKQ